MRARSWKAALETGLVLIFLAFGVSAEAAGDAVASAKEAQKICGAGYFLIVHPDGSKSCLGSLPPRSQADCPPKSTFRVIAGEGGCTLNLDSPGYITGGHPSDPIPNPCEHDSDCPTSFCGADGRCAPPTAQH